MWGARIFYIAFDIRNEQVFERPVKHTSVILWFTVGNSLMFQRLQLLLNLAQKGKSLHLKSNLSCQSAIKMDCYVFARKYVRLCLKKSPHNQIVPKELFCTLGAKWFCRY